LLWQPRRWRQGLDSDLRLLLAIALIVAGVLAASLLTIREVERHLLKSAATGQALHWAEFLQSHLRGLDEILAAGLVSEDDQRIFEFAGAAGSVQSYQIIRPNGIVALSNWSGDFRGATDMTTLRSVLFGQRTVAQVIEETLNGEREVIGQAYVVLTSSSGRQGVLKVDVDVTREADRFRRLGNGAFLVLIALLVPPGGLVGWLIARNISAQRRSERLQRERGRVLESLTRGVQLERVLLRIARYVERHRPGIDCIILTLNEAASEISLCVAPGGCEDCEWLGGMAVADLPVPYAGIMKARQPIIGTSEGARAFWSTPLLATSGQVLGALVLRCRSGAAVAPPDPGSAETVLALLAAFAVETRRAELALSEMRQRNKLILGAADDGIIGIDDEGRITFANPAAARILKRSISELTGAAVDAVLQPISESFQMSNEVAAALSEGRARQVEHLDIMVNGGRELPVHLAITPLADGPASLRAVAVFHDISTQIAAQQDLYTAKEQAEAANRSKSGFLAHMSHELRTPLNAIIGFSEVMAEQTLGALEHPQYREYVRHIHNSGSHLLSLINDLLDLSKIEAGKLELWEEDVRVSDIFDRCRIFVSELAHNKGVTFIVAPSAGLPALRCDRRKLKQILVNLLSNAVKYTPSGGRVELLAEEDGAGGVILRVADNGIGIAPHEIKTVLEPFGQVRGAMTRDTEGTGLGLPLTKALVELHGGTLELRSRLGKGTTAIVRLPGRALDPAAVPRRSEQQISA
jgi:PAS domain S-box-containing protein